MSRFINTFLIRSWWVIAFLLGCLLLYEQGLQKREYHYQQLKEQLAYLQQEKNKVLNKQQHLQLRFNSQSDPAWIELILMKELGLTPEGHQKVYFSPESQ